MDIITSQVDVNFNTSNVTIQPNMLLIIKSAFYHFNTSNVTIQLGYTTKFNR